MNELVIFDVDGTILPYQSQQRFLKYLFKHGYISIFSFIPLTFWFILYKFGITKDPKKAIILAMMFLKGWDVKPFRKIVDDFFCTELQQSFFPEALEEIKKHRMSGRRILLLSNAIDPLVSRIADYLKIDEFICTKLEIKDSQYTGKIIGPIVYGEAKAKLTENYLHLRKMQPQKVWGYADHESDVDFLKIVDVPFVVNPTNKLAEIAAKNRWTTLIFYKKI